MMSPFCNLRTMAATLIIMRDRKQYFYVYLRLASLLQRRNLPYDIFRKFSTCESKSDSFRCLLHPQETIVTAWSTSMVKSDWL